MGRKISVSAESPVVLLLQGERMAESRAPLAWIHCSLYDIGLSASSQALHPDGFWKLSINSKEVLEGRKNIVLKTCRPYFMHVDSNTVEMESFKIFMLTL